MTEKALTKKLSGTRELTGAPKARIVIARPAASHDGSASLAN
jgi:hypothetical protein